LRPDQKGSAEPRSGPRSEHLRESPDQSGRVLPGGGGRTRRRSIRSMTTVARYDGLADWYDERLTDFVRRGTAPLIELLGDGPGRCLEMGCGGGVHPPAIAAAGWSVVGLDVSRDQPRVARRSVPAPPRLVLADAARLPFSGGAFDAVVAVFIHTDVDDWPAVLAEARRVLRPGGRLVYVGTHPCFVGPFSRCPGAEPPVLHLGYRRAERTAEGPGFGDGLRQRVGGRTGMRPVGWARPGGVGPRRQLAWVRPGRSSR
jgi:SAM-dependent methyltransferase